MNKPSTPSTAKTAVAVKKALSRWHVVRSIGLPLAGLLVLAFALLGYRLGSFMNLSPVEMQTVSQDQYIRHIAGAPLDLPYKVVSHLSLMLPFGSTALQARLPSLAAGLIAVALFYLTIRRWHGRRNAILPTLLFVTSGWLLHSGRFGAGLIAITATILALIATATWLNAADEDRDKGHHLLLFSIAAALALFIPAGLWFVFAAGIIMREDIAAHFKTSIRARKLATIAIPTLALIVVIGAIVHHPEQLGQWIGVPIDNFPNKDLLLRYAAGSVMYIFARGPFMPEVWLAHTPLLDVATAGLMLLGLVFYLRRLTSIRVQLLAGFLLLSVGLITLNGPYALAYMAPLLYLLAGTGFVYLLHEWYKVFPRNPIARGIAMGLAAIIMLSTTAYHTQRYFLAWHRSPDTSQAYRAVKSTAPLDLLQ